MRIVARSSSKFKYVPKSRFFSTREQPPEIQQFVEHTRENPQLVYLYQPLTKSNVCLVGVSHNHKEYPAVVRQVIETVAPQKVIVEVDANRVPNLYSRYDEYFGYWRERNFFDLGPDDKPVESSFLNGLTDLIHLQMAQSQYERLQEQEGIDKLYGYELYTAISLAVRDGIKVVLADQSVNDTFKAAFKEGDFKDAFITQRDKLFCDALWNCLPTEPKIVGVVGIGHLEGIERFWGEENKATENLGKIRANSHNSIPRARSRKSLGNCWASVPATGSKILNDPIHGHIEMPRFCLDVIDTPQFQRLRDLKQLGTTYLTFPGASHNRFEHSIGVCHLSGTLIKRFQVLQPELEISAGDIRNVTMAGLVHDLGHGPFSHSFEKWVRQHRPSMNFHHEEMSKKMFRYLIDDNNLDYEEEDIQLIEQLVSGVLSEKNQTKAFMGEIVANNRNSVDVDKFDYLARDCYNCGIKATYDFSRIMLFSRVINNEICYHAKEGWNLNSLFNTRYSLFKQVYSHRVGSSIEYMIGDAFSLADSHLKITQRASSPQTYTFLTDCVLKEIESSVADELKPSRDIIKRIRKRDLYAFVDEFIVPGSEINNWKVPTPANLVTHGSSEYPELREEDVIVDLHTNNYALRDKNPIDNIHFFTKWDSTESFSLQQNEISLLAPRTFSETYIRIYTREPSKKKAVQAAWHSYVEKNSNSKPSPQHSFPGEKKKLDLRDAIPKRLQLDIVD